MRGVIYKYTNIHNGKVYIGQTSYFGDKSNSNLIYAIQGKYRHKYYREYKWKYYGAAS